MKVFSSIVLALCVACINSEAPGYPASGWKPNGRLLALPSRQEEAPKPVYGPPSTFRPPTHSYGPPSTVDFNPTTDLPNTTPVASAEESTEVEGSGDGGSSAQQKQAAPNVESGLYYVLLADGRLQRVEYVTAPLTAFESEKQTAFPGFPGFQVEPVDDAAPAATKPFKYQTQPPTTATQFQFGAFQENQNQGFNSDQFNQAQQASNKFGYNKIQVKGSNFKSAAFIQPVPAAPAPTPAPAPQPQYLIAPNPASVSAFATFQQYQAEKAYAAQQAAQLQAAQQQAAPAPVFQGFVSNVQYKDVEPITAPVYAYQGADNFARILK